MQADDKENNNNKNQALCLQQDEQIDSKYSQIPDIKNNESEDENENCDFFDTVSATSTTRYDFMFGKDINGYVEEPIAVSFIVEELYVKGTRDSTICDTQISEIPDFPGKDFPGKNSETEEAHIEEEAEYPVEKQGQETFTVDEIPEVEDDPVENSSDETEKQEHGLLAEIELSVMDKLHQENRFLRNHEVESISESYSSPSHPKLESISPIDLSPRRDHQDAESITYEYSPEDKYDGEESVPEILPAVFGSEEENRTVANGESVPFSAQHDCSDDEYIELEPNNQNSIQFDPNALAGKDSQKRKTVQDPDDQNDLEFQWDHDDLIEQLKLELRNVRTGGLPTILEEEGEESESPIVVEDLKLKPLKIDLKFDYKDRVEEIQKVYRSYAEKMRKLDILNNQTMHAIGTFFFFYTKILISSAFPFSHLNPPCKKTK